MGGHGGLCRALLLPAAVGAVEEQEAMLPYCLKLLLCLVAAAVVVAVAVLDCSARQLPVGCHKSEHPAALLGLSENTNGQICDIMGVKHTLRHALHAVVMQPLICTLLFLHGQ